MRESFGSFRTYAASDIADVVATDLFLHFVPYIVVNQWRQAGDMGWYVVKVDDDVLAKMRGSGASLEQILLRPKRGTRKVVEAITLRHSGFATGPMHHFMTRTAEDLIRKFPESSVVLLGDGGTVRKAVTADIARMRSGFAGGGGRSFGGFTGVDFAEAGINTGAGIGKGGGAWRPRPGRYHWGGGTGGGFGAGGGTGGGFGGGGGTGAVGADRRPHYGAPPNNVLYPNIHTNDGFEVEPRRVVELLSLAFLCCATWTNNRHQRLIS